MSKINTKQFIKNVGLVLLVQVVSTCVSLVMGFVVPRFISEISYSNWQVYILYSNYSAIFHFGLFDGFILRYSLYDYDNLNKKSTRSQLYLWSLIIDLISVSFLVVAFLFLNIDFLLLLLIVIGIVLKNIFRYGYYLLQTTNLIKDYSISVLIERLVYCLIVVLLLIFKIDNYYLYCISDFTGIIFAVLYIVLRKKELYIGKLYSIKETIPEFKANISTGIFITLATFGFSFLVAGSKMIVQWHWDKLTFGQVSFSVSVMNAFLGFISAASVVFLPSLKRIDIQDLPKVYKKIRDIISILLFTGILFYFPLKELLNIWLPNYSSGIFYVGLILPSIIFMSKVTLLTNNYLKYYFREKIMLLINVIFMIASFVLSIFFAYICNNLILLLFTIDFCCMLNSIVSEIIVSKIIKINLIKDFVIEIIISILFVLIAFYLDALYGFLSYLFIVIVYLVINKEYLKTFFVSLKDKDKIVK